MHISAESAPALVASLFDDPFYQAITIDFGDDAAGRKRALGLYFEYSLREAERAGRCVFDPEPGLGAAAWLLPRTPGVEAAQAKAKAEYLALVLGPRGNENYQRMVRFMSPLTAQTVPADAWYLSIVGVLPAAQGRGVGARLLAPTLAEADQARAVCYLETFTPRNFSFYERLGFRRVAVHREPTADSDYTVMRRDAAMPGAPARGMI